MTKSASWELVINRTARDGWHVYTCDKLPGLYVADRDDGVAYLDVCESIKQLFLLEFGLKIEVEPLLSFEEFSATVPPEERAREIMNERTAELMADGDSTLTLVIHGAATAAHR